MLKVHSHIHSCPRALEPSCETFATFLIVKAGALSEKTSFQLSELGSACNFNKDSITDKTRRTGCCVMHVQGRKYR